MRGWMGGRRRRVIVEGRNPAAARQRQFFARRRERFGRQHPVNQPRNAANPERSVPLHRAHPRRRPAPNGPSGRPQHISADLLQLGNLAAVNAAVKGAHVRKRLRRDVEEPPKSVVVKVEKEHDAKEIAFATQLRGGGDAQNEIRIFDGDRERTHLFRKRKLTESFLNSQQLHDDRRESRGRQDLDGEWLDEVEVPLKRARVDEMEGAGLLEGCGQESEGSFEKERNAPRELQVAKSLQDVVVSVPSFYQPAVTQELRHVDGNELNETAQAPYSGLNKRSASLSENESEHNHENPWVINDVDRTETGVGKCFPAVELDSDSEELPKLGGGREEKDCKKGYESILAKEALDLECLSAELLDLEYKMLDDPDTSVRAFSKKCGRRKQGCAKGSEKQGDKGLEPEAARSDQKDGDESKAIENNGSNAQDGMTKVRRGDRNESEKGYGEGWLHELEVCVSGLHNPVTIAAGGIDKQHTTNQTQT